MEKKISKKDEKFMKDFIGLYLEKKELELNHMLDDKSNVVLKDKLREINGKLNNLLPEYSRLFDNDLKILYSVFNKIINEKNISFFNKKFDSFLKGVFEELYEQKIINKDNYNYLMNWISEFNLDPRKSGSGELGGAMLGF